MVFAATTASAENRAAIMQMGIGNMQSTFQAGSNTAVVVQVGVENDVELAQNGEGNVAAIAQVGENHSRTVVQDGDRLGYGSIQANNALTGSFSQTGGNSFTSITGELDIAE
jgi:hypothetical protein